MSFEKKSTTQLDPFKTPFITPKSLLAMIALSAVQSSAQTFIHNAILFIDTLNYERYCMLYYFLTQSSTLANLDAISVDNF